MSRSYRKHAYVTENQGDKCPRRFRAKTMANRMVRRSDDIPQNSAYRKIYDSWSICDWRFTLTEKSSDSSGKTVMKGFTVNLKAINKRTDGGTQVLKGNNDLVNMHKRLA